ncbi:MAG: flagellar FlbD family protein [Oscillospiraceae bacterium]|nr:flagellar FlbD family protein [Oscillospiraceae bacterium]
MIILTKLDGKEFLLNEELIEVVNETPDTVIVLENGHSYIVRESISELMEKIREKNRLARRDRLKSGKTDAPLT